MAVPGTLLVKRSASQITRAVQEISYQQGQQINQRQKGLLLGFHSLVCAELRIVASSMRQIHRFYPCKQMLK